MVVGAIPRTWSVLKFDFDVDSAMSPPEQYAQTAPADKTRAAAMYRMYDVSGQSI
jgi:hypothetical protein